MRFVLSVFAYIFTAIFSYLGASYLFENNYFYAVISYILSGMLFVFAERNLKRALK
ncbi:hypothetical protein D3C87_81470 [compost metagenome]